MPYTGVKTSILVLDRVEARRNPNIMFSDVRHIGVSLGVKRTPTEHNDLPHVLRDYRAYYSGGELSRHSWLAPREAVLSGDANLTGKRYPPVEGSGEQRFVTLGEVCRITKGSFSSTKTPAGPYRLVLTAADSRTADGYDFDGPAVCVPLISSLGHGKAALHRIHYADGKFALANLLVALQPKDEGELEPRFLYAALDARRHAIAGLMQGAANVGMKPEDLAAFEFPLPPLEVQKEIVAEIGRYQKVIDGARAVLDNYRPHIPIHPDWPIVELGEIAEIIRGITFAKSDQLDHPTADSLAVATTKAAQHGGIVEDDLYYIPRSLLKDDAKLLRRGDILISTANSLHLLGRTTHIDRELERPTSFGAFMSVIRPSNRVRDVFLLVCARADRAIEFYRQHAKTTTNISNLNTSELAHLTVPLPPLDTQRAIVAEIEAEQALVNANRELITRFENKIQATLARVWGEDEPTPAEA